MSQIEDVKKSKKKLTPEELVASQKSRHVAKGYDWLTQDIADNYRNKVKNASRSASSNIGILVDLREDMMKKYGVSEIEAINILNGMHVTEYVAKYYRIKNLIPLRKSAKETKPIEDEDH